LLFGCVPLHAKDIVEISGHTRNTSRLSASTRRGDGVKLFGGLYITYESWNDLNLSRGVCSKVVPIRNARTGRSECLGTHLWSTVGCRLGSRHLDPETPRFLQTVHRCETLHCARWLNGHTGRSHPRRTAGQGSPKCLLFPKSASSYPPMTCLTLY
jgi:hypothetical protein